MKNLFQNKTIFSYFLLLAAVLSIVAAVLSIINPGFPYSKEDYFFFASALVGAVLSLVAFVLPLHFMPAVSSLGYGFALGRIIYSGAAVIADKANNISYVGGSFPSIVIYLILLVLACLLTVVCCFNPLKKAD